MSGVPGTPKVGGVNTSSTSNQHKIHDMVGRFIANEIDKGKAKPLGPGVVTDLGLNSNSGAVNVTPKREDGADYRYVVALGNLYVGRTPVAPGAAALTEWYLAGKAPGAF